MITKDNVKQHLNIMITDLNEKNVEKFKDDIFKMQALGINVCIFQKGFKPEGVEKIFPGIEFIELDFMFNMDKPDHEMVARLFGRRSKE